MSMLPDTPYWTTQKLLHMNTDCFPHTLSNRRLMTHLTLTPEEGSKCDICHQTSKNPWLWTIIPWLLTNFDTKYSIARVSSKSESLEYHALWDVITSSPIRSSLSQVPQFSTRRWASNGPCRTVAQSWESHDHQSWQHICHSLLSWYQLYSLHWYHSACVP